MNEHKKKLAELNTKIFKDKKVLVVLLVGLLGVLLIALSGGNTARKEQGVGSINFDEREYVESLEKRLKEVLVQIDGVGDCQFLVTLDTGIEYIYATEGKATASASVNDMQSVSTSQSNKEDSYIIVRDSNGAESPILLKTVEPMVKGVAVVCDGGDKIIVKQKIVETVSTVLNISSNRVCVIKKGN